MMRLRNCFLRAVCMLVLSLAASLTRSDPQGSAAAAAVPPLPADVPSSAVLHSVLMSGNAGDVP